MAVRPVTAANVLAVATFVCIVGLAYAGADHPPPPGFVVVVILAAFAAAISRALSGMPSMRATGAGAAFAVVCALGLIAVSYDDQSVVAAAIFVAVLAICGALWGLGVRLAALLLTRGHTDSEPNR